MNRQEHFLTILSEECVEVAKEISKALRFSLDETVAGQSLSNRRRIQAELQDLYAMVILCYEEGILDDTPMVHLDHLGAKRQKVEDYLKVSFAYGTLTP